MRSCTIRPTRQADIEATFGIRASTRQNPIPRSQLIAWGITPESAWEKLACGDSVGRVCEDLGKVVAFATGCVRSGEVLVIAVLPEYEGKGIGKSLLAQLVAAMRAEGCPSPWLSASPDPSIRAHGFYRANGWVPTGKRVENGDEILVLKD